TQTARLELLGESAYNGRALLNTDGEERSLTDEARDFILGELGDGQQCPAGEMFKRARQIGISKRTLQRARGRAGVFTKKADFGGGWVWYLPEDATPTAPWTDGPDGALDELLYPCEEQRECGSEGAAPGERRLGDNRPRLGDDLYPDLLAA